MKLGNLKDLSAALPLEELSAIGIKARLSDNGKLRLKPKSRITPELIERVRAEQEQLARLIRERAETDHIAQLDVERRDADRPTGRGYDCDCSAPGHSAYLARTGQRCACQISDKEQRERELDRLARADGWLPPSPAHAIIEVCRRYGVALRIDNDGALVIGKAGAKADEPTQPWPSLLVAIEGHIDAVAELVAAGWYLPADFPERGAAGMRVLGAADLLDLREHAPQSASGSCNLPAGSSRRVSGRGKITAAMRR